jgi:hypothetical protein
MRFSICQHDDPSKNHVYRSCEESGRQEQQQTLTDVRTRRPVRRLRGGDCSADIANCFDCQLLELVLAWAINEVVELTETANDEGDEVPSSLSGQLKNMKKCCNTEECDKRNGCDFAGIVMVEKELRSWNKPLN